MLMNASLLFFVNAILDVMMINYVFAMI